MDKFMKYLSSLLFVLVATGMPVAHAAKDIDNLGALGQANFRLLSQDLGAALSYKALATGEPLGVTGFAIGLSLTGTDLQHPEAWQGATTSADAPDTLLVPKLQVSKGLPAGFDIGAFITSVPDTNIQLLGGELGYAIIDGSMALPSLSVRGTFSRLSGVDQLDLNTTGVELSISKGLAVFTPYAGVGRIWTDSEPATSTGLTSESLQQNKYFLGANINFMLFNLSLEIDETDAVTSYNSMVGVRF